MTCYRQKCERKNECDRYVAAACVYRVDKKQLKLKLEINKNICRDCLNAMVHAKYKNKEIMLCTTCNNILAELRSKGA